MTNLQRNRVLAMTDGILTIALNGPTTGWAKLAIKTDQLIEEDGHHVWEISPSGLRNLRDLLNKHFPD
jgi:hypothetical protein